ncbi:peptidase U32 family protein [Marinifilum caeruleilacunae]|uniref:U32 family peptidase n=1 Tax=Marinifilum caeruleilacunae TaxID=2499076 RepID=A0ABX1WVK9_9BACT|nr:peptidase U32 family protein [Marinifilum caeruleilacunae]NOU60129.1 U32 family peptidase [Marinifilum caeruleilacunae]
MNKPELLLPVGNPEMFHAAVKGGADAVYLGLRQFNARGRASNFTSSQLLALIKIARKNNMKVYLTLNTVIKNEELPDLLDTLNLVQKIGVDAIIIQDWGVYYLVKKHFPKITVHASTQMAHHNSLGAIYCKDKDFERVVMARELTLPELKEIRKKSDIELEIFMHGALCYSFSGMCLFSSFLGGSGANRGLCAQPCRRFYETGKEKSYVFSLKDNQAVDVLPDLMKMGVESIKIEGRLKPAEFVYNVSRAYRKVIDENDVKTAKEILAYDMGREKTGYFLAGNVNKAITENTNTGILIGRVEKRTKNTVIFTSNHEIKVGNRVRFKQKNGEPQKAVKVKEFRELSKASYELEIGNVVAEKGDQVYLAGMMQEKFPNKFREEGKPLKANLHRTEKAKILHSLGKKNIPQKEQVYVRIDSLAWLRKVHLNEVNYLILNLKKSEWEELKWDVPFLQKNAQKIMIELPKFIQEKDLDFYKQLCKKAMRNGYQNFMLSHISQKLLLPNKARVSCNENVYLFNDAAIAHLRDERINLYSHPQENDLENLLKSNDRFGIVPVYFYPQLFYSRMPVKTVNDELIDDMQGEYNKELRDGMTIVYPKHPVTWMQQKNNLYKEGFRRFLIDLSNEKVSSNTFKRLMKNFQQSKQVQPSTSFNLKKGLK